MRTTVKITFLLSGIYFLLGVLTLSHYGINWDTINHLPRGQAYLHYFLTGKKDYSDLPVFRLYWQNPESLLIDTDIPRSEVPRRSLYQTDAITFNWAIEKDGKGGHPPVSDILASLFNLVFFQKLHFINDIDAYRVYGIFLAASLVGLVFWWGSSAYGKFAGLVSALSLSLYPLFWSESHFNIEKDVPETVFGSFMLFATWKGVVLRSWRWTLASGLFFGLALGTKFNIVFIPFVIIPWFIYFAFSQGWFLKPWGFVRENKAFLISVAVAPILGLAILLGSWPYLWQDVIGGLLITIQFYKNLGLTSIVDAQFAGPLNINTYPAWWVLFTTPVVTLILFFLGFIVGIGQIHKEKDKASLLFLLWFLVPLARVIWPGTTIYGGVRQIMEYIPAMSLLAGLGGMALRNLILSKLCAVPLPRRERIPIFISVLVLTAFLPIFVKLIQIHPNENVFFNFLVGGLAGAKERSLPAAGNSFGASYRQAVSWINKNAEKEAGVAFAFELMPNIPEIWLRRDITFHNTQRSGPLRKGEYALTLTYGDTETRSYYDSYLERFLEPVYKVEVDGVPILKVWKNDEQHVRSGFLKEVKVEHPQISLREGGFRIDLGQLYFISRIEVEFGTKNCTPLSFAYSRVSDDGTSWRNIIGTMPRQNWNVWLYSFQPKETSFIQPFAAEKTRYIDYVVVPEDACFRQIEKASVYYLPDLMK